MCIRDRYSAAQQPVQCRLQADVGSSRIAPVSYTHLARSRNDQVALDLRLWLRLEITETQALIHSLVESLVEKAEENIHTLMPGFTHLQKAQPISFAHHLLAYVQMFRRDYERLADCLVRMNYCPLGSGALAGTDVYKRQM